MNESILALIIMVFVIISFVWNKIPMGLTALIGAILMGLLGVISYEEIFLGFVNDATLMVIGVMILGEALFESGVVDIMSERLLSIRLIDTEKKYIFALMVLAGVTSAFLSNTATVAMIIPLVNSIAVTHEDYDPKNFLLPIAIMSVIGGNATLIGSTPNMVSFGILTSTTAVEEVPFFLLTEITLPIMVSFLLFYSFFGYRFGKKIFFDHPAEEGVEALDEGDLAEPVEKKEVDRKKTLVTSLVFIATVLMFVFSDLPLGLTAIIGAIIVYLAGGISGPQVKEAVDWSTVLTLGGSLALANGMESSGALALLTESILGVFGSAVNAVTIGIFLVIFCTLMSNFMSNTAVAAFMTPIGIALAEIYGVSPVIYTMLIITGCNMAFATPISTAPITMTLTAGYEFKDYLIFGGLSGLVGVLVAIGYFMLNI